MIFAEPGPEEDCPDEAQQQLKITERSYRQRGHPITTNLQLSGDNFMETEKRK
jgi:hypothetical protein